MKLISCHVENFGRLQNFDYVFSDGVNVICRENGWGKSTFAAFLLAMFYGLPSKGKKRQAASSGNRLSLQNARDTYRPWQGGIFGGQLIFEAGGRTYEMTRVFGNREAEDEFDLRDPDTNLPCFDYSKNIGRELFALDRESFLRTVFTSQQDCVTQATDDVNALVADLADSAGDMESYEDAQKRLRDAANRLTPGRATGRLHRLAEQIGQLERRTAASNDLGERIALCAREQRELQRKSKELENEKIRLEQEIAAAERREQEAAEAGRADRELLAKRQILQRLYRTDLRRREALRKVSAYFPGRVPTRAETDVLLQNCREMERLEERMQAEQLTEEEQERLTILEETFSGSDGFAEMHDSPGSDGFADSSDAREASFSGGSSDLSFPADDMRNRAVSEKREVGKEPEKISRSPENIPVFAAGILLVIAALVLTVLAFSADGPEGLSAPLTVAAALVLAAAGAGITVKAALDRTGRTGTSGIQRSQNGGPRTIKTSGQYPANKPPGEHSRAYAEYKYLEKKEEKLEQTHADWAEARKPILRFLRELGFAPAKDLHAQLTDIRDAADECEDASLLLRESDEELRAFEEELLRSGLTAEELRRAMPEEETRSVGETRTGGEKRIADMNAENNSPGQILERNGKFSELRRRREKVNEELLQCRSQEADLERRMEDLTAEREEREAILEEVKELRAQQQTDLAAYRQITTASSLLQKARESLTARYADPIRTGFCRYWEMITGVSAAGVYVDANSNVTVEEKGKQRDAAFLSTGWQDLAGICLRTALADAMYPPERGERPPLILDDPFTNLDDVRMEGAMRFLGEAGRHYQIIYFTCSRNRC